MLWLDGPCVLDLITHNILLYIVSLEMLVNFFFQAGSGPRQQIELLAQNWLLEYFSGHPCANSGRAGFLAGDRRATAGSGENLI
jgi:hypothetical protein